MKQNIPNTKRRATALISALSAVLACGLAGCASEQNAREAQTPKESQKTEVVCIYYPHWHVYPEGEKWFGKNWTEWEFVKTAVPRFKGHKQPMKPLMGYLDGKSPDDLAKEIELASNSGIDVFLYDWYFYGDGIQTMSESLEQGFLKAPNSGKMKFAIMWCYHDRRNAFRPEYGKPRQMLQPLSRTPQEFLNAVEYCAKNYFTKPNYWRVDGKPYFSIFAAAQFMSDMGGAEKTRELLKKADAVSVKYCGKPVHWSGMVFGRKNFDDYAAAQFDSLSNYNVNPSAIPDFRKYAAKRRWVFEYSQMADAHRLTWNFYANAPMKFIPDATSGWDSSPRCRADVEFPWKKAEYPYGTIATNNTGDKFEALLRDAKAFTEKSQKSPRAVLINGWNEYTEGSFLIPTLRDGDSMRLDFRLYGGRRDFRANSRAALARRSRCLRRLPLHSGRRRFRHFPARFRAACRRRFGGRFRKGERREVEHRRLENRLGGRLCGRVLRAVRRTFGQGGRSVRGGVCSADFARPRANALVDSRNQIRRVRVRFCRLRRLAQKPRLRRKIHSAVFACGSRAECRRPQDKDGVLPLLPERKARRAAF